MHSGSLDQKSRVCGLKLCTPTSCLSTCHISPQPSSPVQDLLGTTFLLWSYSCLGTSESHQSASRQAVVDKSNTDKIMIKDLKAILQTFSVWTAQVRGYHWNIQATALQKFPIWQGPFSHPVSAPEQLQLLNSQGLAFLCQQVSADPSADLQTSWQALLGGLTSVFSHSPAWGSKGMLKSFSQEGSFTA